MSKASRIRDLAKQIPHPSPGTIARKLSCHQNYVLRVAWPETYWSVKAGERSQKREAQRAP